MFPVKSLFYRPQPLHDLSKQRLTRAVERSALVVWSRYGHAGPGTLRCGRSMMPNPSRNSDPALHQQFDTALVDKPPRAPPLPVGIGARHLAYLPKGEL